MGPNDSPCNGCEERFLACSDRCPKDERADYGYKAWKADQAKLKAKRKEYIQSRREDWLRSEQCEAAKHNYVKSKSGKNFRRV